MSGDMFVPPSFEIPPQAPTTGDGSNINVAPNSFNAPSQEKEGQWAKSVRRSAKIRKATGAIITTRAQFKAYLQENGLDLYTSAIEFQQTGDFILSSYVVYTNQNNYLEPLGQFLQRYPNLQNPVIAIRDQLRPVKDSMDVSSPKLSGINPFGGFN